MKVTNISDGPRGIRTSTGVVVMLDKGQSADLDLADGEEDAAEEWFEIGAGKPSGPPALKGMNKAELLDQASAEGAEVADDATNADIIKAIEAKRAEAS